MFAQNQNIIVGIALMHKTCVRNIFSEMQMCSGLTCSVLLAKTRLTLPDVAD